MIVMSFCCSIIPESPRWLYSKNKEEQAEVIVRKMAKINHAELPEKLRIEVTVSTFLGCISGNLYDCDLAVRLLDNKCLSS